MGFLAPRADGRQRTAMRLARLSDVPRLVDMGLRFIETSSYRNRFAKNRHALERLMERLITTPEGYICVCEHQGVVTGMIGAAAYLHPWSGEWIAGEFFWWVDPEHRGSGIRLLKAAERWAEDKGCVRFQMIAPDERVASVYQSLGYSKLEECYQREL